MGSLIQGRILKSNFKNNLNYDLMVNQEDGLLDIQLDAKDDSEQKYFGMEVGSVPQSLKKHFKNVSEMHTLLLEKENFRVNPMKG